MSHTGKEGEWMKRITKIDMPEPLITKKLRVAAYCRVSTGSDEQLVSLEAQKSHYESFIKANPEWEFAGVYYDEGITGTKKEKRTQLLRLISDCEAHKVDFIVVKSISRFARNTTDCLELVRKLTDLGVFIYFEKENINTQSMESELMLSILSSLAESESVSISENSKWGVKRRFQNGTFKISYPPYGYDYVDGGMENNQEQAETVKYIFAQVLAGVGTHQIADELNARKVPTKKGGKWTASTVRGMIYNEKYVGDVIFQKTYTDEHFNRHTNYGEKDQYLMECHHEPIISREDFEAAGAVLNQRRLEKGITKGSGKYLNRYPFSGKIICSECGGKFKRRIHSKNGGKYVAWCCGKHIDDVTACSMKFIRNADVEKAFVTMMNKLVYGRRFVLRPLLESLREMDRSDSFGMIQELELKMEKNAEQRQILTGLMAKGYLEPALFNKENNELLQEAAELEMQKNGLSHSVNGEMVKTGEVEALLKFAEKGEMLTAFDGELFGRFVEQITVYSRNEIGFQMKCGLTLRERM